MSLNISIGWDTTENFLELHVACQMLHQVRPQLIVDDILMSSCISLSIQILAKLGQHVWLDVLHQARLDVIRYNRSSTIIIGRDSSLCR